MPLSPLCSSHITKTDQGIKVNSDNLTQTLIGLEKLIRDYSDYPFDYQFLDDQFDQTYREDDVLVKL